MPRLRDTHVAALVAQTLLEQGGAGVHVLDGEHGIAVLAAAHGYSYS